MYINVLNQWAKPKKKKIFSDPSVSSRRNEVDCKILLTDFDSSVFNGWITKKTTFRKLSTNMTFKALRQQNKFKINK